MKKIAVLFFSVLQSLSIFSQNSTTSTLMIHNRFFNESELIKFNKCVFDSAFVKINKTELTTTMINRLDSIAVFLINHNRLTLNVNCFYVEDPKSSTMIALIKARSVCDFLIEKGVNKTQVIPIGYQTIKPPINLKKRSTLRQLEFKITNVE